MCSRVKCLLFYHLFCCLSDTPVKACHLVLFCFLLIPISTYSLGTLINVPSLHSSDKVSVQQHKRKTENRNEDRHIKYMCFCSFGLLLF